MTFINCGEQEHHIFVELTLGVPLANAIDAFYNNLINHLTCVPVYKGYPLIYQISFLIELNLDGFQHFNTSYDIM